MMKMKLISMAAAALVFPALAFAQGMHMGTSPADKGNMAAMEKMQRDMPKHGTGDADKDFAMMMIPHHQGAIDMARVELEHGKDPELKAMAKMIVEAQEKEIATLKAWLAKHK